MFHSPLRHLRGPKPSRDRPTGALRARLFGLLVIASFGCAKEPVRAFISSADVEYVLAFLVVVDEGDHPIRITDPRGYDDADLRFGEPPELSLEPGDRAFFVAVDETGLRASSEAYQPSLLSEIRVGFDADPMMCGAGRVVDDGRHLHVPLPANTRLFEVNPDALELVPITRASMPLFEQIRLELPIPEHGCDDLSPPFVPFFSDPEAITREVGAFETRDLLRLDDDRVLLLSERGLLLLDRASPVPVRRLLNFNRFTGRALGTAVSRPVARGVPVSLVVAGQGASPVGSATIVAHDVVYDGELGAVLTRSSTVGPGRLRELAINEAGSVVLVGEDADLYTREPNTPSFVAQTFADGPTRYSAVAGANGQFWVGGESGLLYEGDPQSGVWSRVEIVHELAIGLRVRAILPPEEGGELWVAGSRGRVLRRGSDLEWHSVDLALPPAFEVCQRGDPRPCGGLDQLNPVEELIFIPGRDGRAPVRLMFINECSAVIAITGDERCPGVLPFGQREIEGVQSIAFSVNDHLPGGWITAGNDWPDSMIYELDLSDPDPP